MKVPPVPKGVLETPPPKLGRPPKDYSLDVRTARVSVGVDHNGAERYVDGQTTRQLTVRNGPVTIFTELTQSEFEEIEQSTDPADTAWKIGRKNMKR